MPVPNTFANATATIPLSQLDANFATTITLGNTAIQLGNTVTTLNNMTLANVTVTSGNVTITNVSVTTANVTTANIGTSIITTSETLNYGTANQVQYLNASKVLTGSANLTFDGTTLTPHTLTVSTGVLTVPAGSNTAPSITTSGDTNTGIYFPAADTVAIGTGGIEALRIDSARNMGLGVTPSAWASPFKVIQGGGATAGDGFIGFQSNTNAVKIGNNAYYNGSVYVYQKTGTAGYMGFSGNQFDWNIAPSGTAGNTITFTQAMTLNASSQLSLNTTTANERFNLYSDNFTYIGMYNSTTGTTSSDGGYIGMSNAELEIRNKENSIISLWTNNTERARITSGGDLFLANEVQSLGLNQYSNKRWLKFNYPAAGQFAAANDCTDFYAAGNGSSLVQMRISQFGNVGARGTFSGGQTLNDYAEYFEWSDGNENNEDRIGMTVVLDGEKVRLTTPQDSPADVVGVVSATAGVILGSAPFEWAGKYKKDEYGRTITRKVTWVHWSQDGESHNYKSDEIPNDIFVPEDAEYKTYDEPVLSDNFSESIEYTAREHRKEWGCIGLVGQVHVKKGQLVGDRWRKMKDVSDNVELWLIR